MKRLPALLPVLLAATLLPLLTVSGADAARTAAPAARNDTVTITAGETVAIRVKANDTAYRKRRATVRLVASNMNAVAGRVRVDVRAGRTIRLATPESLEPGTYTLR